jgi:hypothetical protein
MYTHTRTYTLPHNIIPVHTINCVPLCACVKFLFAPVYLCVHLYIVWPVCIAFIMLVVLILVSVFNLRPIV